MENNQYLKIANKKVYKSVYSATCNMYYVREHNNKDERIQIELTDCNAGPISKAWYKNGSTKKDLTSYISCIVYVYTPDGKCVGKYNPTIKDKTQINFDWVLEVSKENKIKLIEEIIRLAFEEYNM